MGWVSLIIAGIVNTISAISGSIKDTEQIKAYQKEIERLDKEKLLKETQMDDQFKAAKDEANKAADRSDLSSDMQEKMVSADVNNQLEQLSLQEIADAYTFNYMAEQNAAQTGNELAGAAASGTRTSSLVDAIDLEAAQNAQQLQLTEDMTRSQRDADLNGILNSLAQNRFNIQVNRTDAMDLRNSYEKGGWQYKLYKDQKDIFTNSYLNQREDLLNAQQDLFMANKNGTNFFMRLFGAEGFTVGQQVGGLVNDLMGSDNNYQTSMDAGKNVTYSWNNIGNSEMKLNRF